MQNKQAFKYTFPFSEDVTPSEIHLRTLSEVFLVLLATSLVLNRLLLASCSKMVFAPTAAANTK